MKSTHKLRVDISITFNLETTTTDDRYRAVELMRQVLDENFDLYQVDYCMAVPLENAEKSLISA